MTPRVILHADMDAFYASVEIHRNPQLRGKPVIVGGDGRRGVVAAASYAARFHGVHSAMPSVRAKRLCPEAIFIPGDHTLYGEVSGRVMEIFGAFTPRVEPLSLDEAFLDVTGAQRLFGDGPAIAAELRQAVFDSEGLWCSVGVAPNKFLAKLASQQAKPAPTPTGPAPGSGVCEVLPGQELAFLHPLPVRALWGVGPSTHERLKPLGIRTVEDLAATPLPMLIAAVGEASGAHLHALANGRDERAVESSSGARSISHEETFRHDISDSELLAGHASRLADAVVDRLRAQKLGTRTVAIKVRFGDFTTTSRQRSFPAPTDARREIAREVRALLETFDTSPGVRLLGVAASRLEEMAPTQLTLEPESDEAWQSTDRAIDEIRNRFGRSAIGSARLSEPGRGIRVKTQGEQQWGPNATPPSPAD